MMYCKRYFLFVVLCTMFFSNESTYSNRLHETVTIPLPYYSFLFKFIKSELFLQRNKQVTPSTMNLLLVNDIHNDQNDVFARCDITNQFYRGYRPIIAVGEPSKLAVINKELDQSNPLHNSSINLLTLFEKKPLIVTKESPSMLCLVENLFTDTNQKMQTSPILNDIYGNCSKGISHLTYGSTGELSLFDYIFAVVKNSDDEGNGIAVIKYDMNILNEVIKDADGKEKTVEKQEPFFNALDATTGLSQGNKAVAILKSVLQINEGNSSSHAQIADIFWNPFVERLYIAVNQRTAEGATSQQGLRALCIGRIDSQNCLRIDPIAPEDLFVGNDKIIGACGADVAISIHQLKPLLTSTGIPYLLIVGGVGDLDQTSKKVFVMPLVDSSLQKPRNEIVENPFHGTIASKNSIPQKRYLITNSKLIGRVLETPAQTQEDMPTMHDSATQVGAGKELPNIISDVIVEGDAVYVTIAEGGNGQHPGIFHSQAILDSLGKIAAWTPWQRIGGIEEGVKSAAISNEQYFLAYLRAEKPELVCSLKKNLTKNKKLDDYIPEGNLADLLEGALPKEIGGIQGLFDFPCTTPGFGIQTRTAMLVATGLKKVVIVETGSDNSHGIFTAYKQNFTQDVIICQNGVINSPSIDDNEGEKIPRTFVVSGGDLDQLGAITCASLVTDGNQSWLVVGGARGLAILSHNDGSGWSNDPGLLSKFVGLGNGMTFKKLGNYKYVKKIATDGAYLYILTSAAFERIVLTPQIVLKGIGSSTILATSQALKGTFFDCGVSGPLALLATSQGLLMNGSATDVRLSDATMQWNLVNLPDSKASVYNLFFVSSDGHKNGFGHQGQVYALVGSLLDNRSSVYRLYVRDVFKEGVTENSVELLEDNVYRQKPFPLFAFNKFRDLFATDGVHYFNVRTGQTYEKPFLQLTSVRNIKSIKVEEAVPYDISLGIGKLSKSITALVQNSATGNWLIGGDFGLRIHN